MTAVVLRREEVLLVRRSDNGRWAPVTGIVDPGEHAADDESFETRWFPVEHPPAMEPVLAERIHTAVGHAGVVRLE